jgi:hypothetical protein
VKLKESTLYPYWAVAVNPVWQSLAVVDFPIPLTTIAGLAKRLRVPNEASPAFDNWFDVIKSKIFKGEFNITLQAMEIVELAKFIPFGSSVRAACLGFAGAAGMVVFPLVFPLGLLAFFGLLVFPLGFPLVLLAFFGLPVFPLAYLAITIQSILSTFIPIKFLGRLSLFALTARLNHFAASSFLYINYTSAKGICL